MNRAPINKSDINNPNNDAYWQARGHPKRPENWQKLSSGGRSTSVADANNSNNDAYWQARGYDGRPPNWRELVPEKDPCAHPGPCDGGYTWPMCSDDY